MTHEAWQQTKEGQRVMLQCWLAGIEKAAYLGEEAHRKRLFWRNVLSGVGDDNDNVSRSLRETAHYFLSKFTCERLILRGEGWGKVFRYTVFRKKDRAAMTRPALRMTKQQRMEGKHRKNQEYLAAHPKPRSA